MRKLSTIFGLVMVISLVLTGVMSAEGIEILDVPGSGWWSAEQIQNIGTDLATLNVTAYDMDSDLAPTTSITITQGSAKTFVPEELSTQAGWGTGDPYYPNFSGRQGAVIVESNQPLVAVVNVTNRYVPTDNPLGVDGGYAAALYEGTDGEKTATTLNFPLLKYNYGGAVKKDTTYYVQNAGNTSAEIHVNFYPSAPAGATPSRVTLGPIGPGDSIAVNPPQTDDLLGSAMITSTVPLAGVLTEHEHSVTGGATTLKATRAFIPADADTTLYVPAFKKNYVGRSSALLIQADAPVDGSMEFICAPGQTGCTNPAAPIDFTIDTAGGSIAPFAASFDPYLGSLSDGLFAVIVRVTSGDGQLVATVDETYFPDPPPVNRDTTYAAIPAKYAATTWSCPVVKERYASNASAPAVLPLNYPTSVDVTYAVVGGGTYTIDDFAIAEGSGVFYDVSAAPAGTYTWIGDAVVPSETNSGVTVEATGPVVVVVNENVHWSATLQQDAKQYNCFPIP